MVRRGGGDYHLLVAQNFLSNISLNGKHTDTNLRIFNRPGISRAPPPTARSGKSDEDPRSDVMSASRSVSMCFASASVTARIPKYISKSSTASSGFRSARVENSAHRNSSKCRNQSLPEVAVSDVIHPVFIPQSVTSQSVDTPSKKKTHQSTSNKKSLFQRFSRIVSSDDVLTRDEERMREGRRVDTSNELTEAEDRPGSPLSTSQNFTFLKRLRTTLTKGERQYFCSPISGVPLLTVTHFPFRKKEQRGETLRKIFTSQERLRQISACSTEELRPFDFREGEEATYGHLIRGERSRTLSIGEKSPKLGRDRRESTIVANLVPADHLPGGISRASSCEPGGASYDLDLELEEDSRHIEYDPNILSEVDGTCRSTVRFAGYSSSVVAYASEDDLKKTMNEKFRTKFPSIQLSYSKFKSLKREMHMLAHECGIDMSTLAIVFVYFEKIVLKAMISKSNRKLVAGASLMVAVKVTDVGKMKLKDLIEKIESRFRLSHRELLSYEIPLCVALNFSLNVPSSLITPHLNKLVFGTV